MPASTPPVRAHPAKPFRNLRDAARDGQLVVLRCTLCRRCVHYLANDLAEVVGDKHPVHIPPFPCSKCRTAEHVTITCRSPHPGDLGQIMVRRPAGWKRIWKTVPLGDV
ncbi:hypothetical protein [Phaeobacter sp. C3_T13_0]|uniref:hypothetical protein n=1 Tax=Phaeobacter cretensis TaxID=3342641 RepID=UPI0039BD8981